MPELMYSIVIYTTDLEGLKRTIESIIKQDYDLSQIELIVENVNEDEEIEEYLKSMENINYIYNNLKETDIASAYNHALLVATGQYITFINSNMYYENTNTLKIISICLEDYDLVAINGGYFDADKNKREVYTMQPKKSAKINLYTTPHKIQMLFESYFFKIERIKKYGFNSKLHDECKVKFLLDVLKEIFIYFYIKEMKLTSLDPFENNTSKCAIQYQSWWYNDSLKKLIIPELYSHEKVPKYIEEACIYLMFAKFNCNTKDRNKNVLSQEDFTKFTELVTKALLKIDDNIIIQTSFNISTGRGISHQYKIPRWLRFWLLNLKIKALNAQKKIKLIRICKHNNLLLEYKLPNKATNSEYISTDRNYNLSEKVKIKAINYHNGELQIDATTSISDFLESKDIKIHAELDEKEIKVTPTKIYSTLKAFGVELTRGYTFKLQFKVDLTQKQKLKFYAVIDNQKILLNLAYDKVQARLSKSKRSFWSYKNILIKNNISNISIEKNSLYKELKSELLFNLSKLKNEKNKKRVIKLIGLRILYYATKPLYQKKHIWITFDKLYKAGDNGEYVYQYGLKNNKNIYYIIQKDSPDYKRLKKQNRKHILTFNSLKAKLLSLQAEAILKTHANILGFCGFDGLARVMVRGLFNAEIIEIQHGLTIQDIPEYQNRLVDNTKLYMIASGFEKKNIEKEEYGYNKNQIKLVGLARYDVLKSNEKRIILITPTWRHNIAAPSLKHGISRGHSEIFKQSNYFKIYNALINNKKLIMYAKKYNYEIVYLLHPTLSSQAEDFNTNEFVKIIPAAGDMSYEKILTESSLMITDYSGVQFDFIYMKKPIIYFQPKELPPHYTNISLNYEKEGFGPIVDNLNDLINKICENMQNECINDKKYIERTNSFFKYNDYNNCERIIRELEKYLYEKVR